MHIYCIYFDSSSNNSVFSNNISTLGNVGYGFFIYYSSGNVLSDNHMDTSHFAVAVGGLSKSDYNHSIDSSNTEKGAPIYYYFDADSITIDNLTDIGELLVTASNNVTIRNLTLHNDGIYLGYVQNSTVTGCEINTNSSEGIRLSSLHGSIEFFNGTILLKKNGEVNN